jgi:hypothetical protein
MPTMRQSAWMGHPRDVGRPAGWRLMSPTHADDGTVGMDGPPAEVSGVGWVREVWHRLRCGCIRVRRRAICAFGNGRRKREQRKSKGKNGSKRVPRSARNDNQKGNSRSKGQHEGPGCLRGLVGSAAKPPCAMCWTRKPSTCRPCRRRRGCGRRRGLPSSRGSRR